MCTQVDLILFDYCFYGTQLYSWTLYLVSHPQLLCPSFRIPGKSTICLFNLRMGSSLGWATLLKET
jgi:hypothetical protein